MIETDDDGSGNIYAPHKFDMMRVLMWIEWMVRGCPPRSHWTRGNW
jgi:hypothetical protein